MQEGKYTPEVIVEYWTYDGDGVIEEPEPGSFSKKQGSRISEGL
jgi:hypothetical protein